MTSENIKNLGKVVSRLNSAVEKYIKLGKEIEAIRSDLNLFFNTSAVLQVDHKENDELLKNKENINIKPKKRKQSLSNLQKTQSQIIKEYLRDNPNDVSLIEDLANKLGVLPSLIRTIQNKYIYKNPQSLQLSQINYKENQKPEIIVEKSIEPTTPLTNNVSSHFSQNKPESDDTASFNVKKHVIKTSRKVEIEERMSHYNSILDSISIELKNKNKLSTSSKKLFLNILKLVIKNKIKDNEIIEYMGQHGIFLEDLVKKYYNKLEAEINSFTKKNKPIKI